ncbi:hypothetical protein MCOR27_004914 [Pyricularia oryzae]|uniref:Cytoplasmic dynein 1 intermediate chain 2 n=5 Tax=Pyricularia TaxID=48558 RepID=A0ABQ8ND56_PYRGI|nr:cytoplasmic dynein 1 intermediate chain 2 [Pyricularia oryzae 70-15]ELQ42737.1 cytoplasmic dynein 1 intermediate chain 2 [Pyricularia oryzae Y34]KAH8837356.1 hypothetical protein MCOR01_010984 [Pyricularia oryzae]KAI6295155.1 hypothetical protein MCOR33_007882 [Pyricularia grisea]EHA53916.1 cytoplasmic dynein 1 intermediate chain 2 [Pyricularia oryzae 70-15]KAH9437968.1 hypothetical protein MCOR02_001609 [Pyricularia oryzae]
MQQRRDEILAKKAKLAELKEKRKARNEQGSASRPSVGVGGELSIPSARNVERREDLDEYINRLVGLGDRPSSTTTGGAASPGPRGSRPNSVLSAGELSNENSEYASLANGHAPAAPAAPQNLTTVPLTTIYECPPSPVKEIFSYSKGIQTQEDWAPSSRPLELSVSDDDEPTFTPSKRPTRRDRDREEELRANIRREIEEELKAAQELSTDGVLKPTALTTNFPARTLTNEELKAVTASEDFVDFVDRATKVIEKALDQEYDILTDYTLQTQENTDDREQGNVSGRGRRKIREIRQFYDERWSKKRPITSIDFSPKFSDLVLASASKNVTAPHEPDGIVQVWNLNLHDRAEFVLHAQSDILTAKFSPFHPNLIIGGAYSGQVLLWDTRSRSSAPVQKTPLTGQGHTHPVYSLDVIGTQNANNIITTSTDGVVCGWSVDMLAAPQESLMLLTPQQTKTDDLSPTCMAFPQADPTYFLVGSEEGVIYPCHRYDRAGAKAGVDKNVSYRGHSAPVRSVDFHSNLGPVDFGDLVLSSSLDWSAKLWKVRPPGGIGTAGLLSSNAEVAVSPLMEFAREDIVYDAAWSPLRPGVFSLVDGAGYLEIWDLTVETEEPVARIQPNARPGARVASLNKVAWERSEGKRLATGGIAGALTVFEVGPDLGGKEGIKSDEWAAVKKLISKLELDAKGPVNGVSGLRN